MAKTKNKILPFTKLFDGYEQKFAIPQKPKRVTINYDAVGSGNTFIITSGSDTTSNTYTVDTNSYTTKQRFLSNVSTDRLDIRAFGIYTKYGALVLSKKQIYGCQISINNYEIGYNKLDIQAAFVDLSGFDERILIDIHSFCPNIRIAISFTNQMTYQYDGHVNHLSTSIDAAGNAIYDVQFTCVPVL